MNDDLQFVQLAEMLGVVDGQRARAALAQRRAAGSREPACTVLASLGLMRAEDVNTVLAALQAAPPPRPRPSDRQPQAPAGPRPSERMPQAAAPRPSERLAPVAGPRPSERSTKVQPLAQAKVQPLPAGAPAKVQPLSAPPKVPPLPAAPKALGPGLPRALAPVAGARTVDDLSILPLPGAPSGARPAPQAPRASEALPLLTDSLEAPPDAHLPLLTDSAEAPGPESAPALADSVELASSEEGVADLAVPPSRDDLPSPADAGSAAPARPRRALAGRAERPRRSAPPGLVLGAVGAALLVGSLFVPSTGRGDPRDAVASALEQHEVEQKARRGRSTIVGSTWVTVEDLPGMRPWTVTFEPGGLLRLRQDEEARAENTWTQDGDFVTMSINNGFSTREGTLSQGRLVGTARNRDGRTWSWSLRPYDPVRDETPWSRGPAAPAAPSPGPPGSGQPGPSGLPRRPPEPAALISRLVTPEVSRAMADLYREYGQGLVRGGISGPLAAMTKEDGDERVRLVGRQTRSVTRAALEGEFGPSQATESVSVDGGQYQGLRYGWVIALLRGDRVERVMVEVTTSNRDAALAALSGDAPAARDEPPAPTRTPTRPPAGDEPAIPGTGKPDPEQVAREVFRALVPAERARGFLDSYRRFGAGSSNEVTFIMDLDRPWSRADLERRFGPGTGTRKVSVSRKGGVGMDEVDAVGHGPWLALTLRGEEVDKVVLTMTTATRDTVLKLLEERR